MIAKAHKDGVSCPACGATDAKPGAMGLCCACYTRAQKSAGWGSDITSEDVSVFAVKELKRRARDLKQGVQRNRCQAISHHENSHHFGYQCGATAKHFVNGRWLCAAHLRHPSPKHVDPTKHGTAAATLFYVQQIAQFDEETRALFAPVLERVA